MTPPANANRSRLTINHAAYFQAPEQNPQLFSVNIAKFLSSDEVPFTRPMTVGEEWVSIDFGWVETPSYLQIKHVPVRREVQPSREEQLSDFARTVLIAFDGGDPVSSLKAGDGFALVPFHGSHKRLRVRSSGGQAKCQISVVPE